MMNKFFKNNWQTFAAIALFLIISCAYFSPALKGYTLKMGDIKNHSGMAKETKDFKKDFNKQTLWTGTSFSGMPTYQIGVDNTAPLKEVQSFFIDLLGFPIFPMFIAFLSFFILAKSFNAGFYIALIGALGYGLTTYNFLIMEAGHATKMMAIAYIPGVIAGMVMIYRREKLLLPFAVLTLFFALELLVNHIQMTYYFVFIMLAFGISEFVRYAKESNYKGFFMRTGLIIFAGLIGLLSNFGNYYNTYEFAKHTMRGKPVISIDANENKATDTRTEEQKKYDEFNKTSGLKRDYIVQWCYGKGETWNLLIPTAKGDKTVHNKFIEKVQKNPQLYNYVGSKLNESRGKIFGPYWGDQPFTGGPNYIGAIVVFLALLYLIFVHTALKWSLLGISILVILLSWGKNLGGSIEDMWLTNFFINNVPLYSKFRAVSSILVVINLVAPLMGVLFLVYLVKNLDWAKKNIKTFAIGGGAVLLVLIVVAMSPSLIGFTSEIERAQLTELSDEYLKNPRGISPIDAFNQVKEIRHEIFSADAWRSIGLMALALGLILLSVYKENLRKVAFGGIALLIIVDLWNVDTRYLNNEKDANDTTKYIAWEKKVGKGNTYVATQGDNAIYQIEVSKNPKIQKEAGEKLQQISNQSKGGVTRQDQEGEMFSALNLNTNYRVMDLDNPFNSARVSYFHKSTGGYNAAKLKRYQDMIDFYIQKELSFLNSRQLDKMKVLNMLNNKYYLYNGQLFTQNTEAYGNAWFVNDIKWVEDNNSEILAIENTDVKNTAIIHKEFKETIKTVSGVDSNANIRMTSYLPNHISYQSTSNKDGLAVFSEVYYADGWNAYIDGAKVPYSRANYIVRALNIPKGNHTVDFKFEPTMYGTGNVINLIGFLLLLGAFGGALYFEFKKEPKLEVELDA
jgi:hypothetical protein